MDSEVQRITRSSEHDLTILNDLSAMLSTVEAGQSFNQSGCSDGEHFFTGLTNITYGYGYFATQLAQKTFGLFWLAQCEYPNTVNSAVTHPNCKHSGLHVLTNIYREEKQNMVYGKSVRNIQTILKRSS